MVSLLAKPKGDEKEIQQFRKKVADDRRTMNALLQQRLQRAEKANACRQNEMSALITEALTKPNKSTSHESMTFANTKIAGNVIYHSVGKVDAACRSMLSEYDALEAIIDRLAGDNKNEVLEKWMKDVEETERLLRLGHKTAVRHVKRVLGAETKGDDTEGEGTLFDDTEGGEKGIGVHKELSLELLEGLRYAERGVKRMVKGLPKTEP
ncbi:uncharacterized protein N0V89_001173 [Didymosphaeria variabile]|uniref:Uncharacterized protein n=1 Tax=Didymosphaeria variabile TaxID=1932322 RepID=A0A9W8XVM4_9PLEO|nr:uncharacterized protein N0V89_001173 [Didymosphaeria variabile]KAJ4360607.1 hypothetical protein N0V89_001173 [Didymosphaeria variabile]